jgi:hypothetical protein
MADVRTCALLSFPFVLVTFSINIQIPFPSAKMNAFILKLLLR